MNRVLVRISVISVAAICVAGISNAQLFARKSEEAKAEARAKTQATINEAEDLAKEQKFAEALKVFDQAIRTEATNSELFLHRGLINLKARRIKAAQLDCET